MRRCTGKVICGNADGTEAHAQGEPANSFRERDPVMDGVLLRLPPFQFSIYLLK